MGHAGSRSVLVLAAVALVGIACATPARASAAVDAARHAEQYVILPGAEPLLSDMLGSGQTMPGGCTFTDGRIERTSVIASYTCGAAAVVLELLHPAVARPGGVRTQRFAITASSGTPPPGLVDALADRIRAREAAFEWTNLGQRRTQAPRRLIWIAVGGAVAAVLALWALRRLAVRRRRTHG